VNAEQQQYSKEAIVGNAYGLHARPAAEFVKLASKYEADILVCKDSLEVNGKSIMGVMMLAAEKGSTLRICGSGADAREAVDALAELVDHGFGEDETGE